MFSAAELETNTYDKLQIKSKNLKFFICKFFHSLHLLVLRENIRQLYSRHPQNPASSKVLATNLHTSPEAKTSNRTEFEQII